MDRSFSLLLSQPLEEPIRSELFSAERFDEHAHSLAAAQVVAQPPRAGVPLGPRSRENGKVLQAAFRYLTLEAGEKRAIHPAGEWLLDSFYVVEEQLRGIRRFLPDDFYNQLPKLAGGFLRGYPRVYGLAWAYVAHTDSRFEPESLLRFVRSYQSVQPLTIGELWALAMTLRVVMVDNLRRIAVYLAVSQEARGDADAFADGALGLVEESREAGRLSPSQLGRQSSRPAFLVQLIQRLRYRDPSGTPSVNWLNERIAAGRTTAEEMSAAVHGRQAADDLTARNLITSFRSMDAFDWRIFFEAVSLTQAVLLAHPDFKKMDFRTRNDYRSAVEVLAKGSGRPEPEIARRAVEKCGAARPASLRAQDPGYHLLGEGRPDFEKEIGFRVPFKGRFLRACMDHPAWAYLGNAFLMTAVTLWIAALLSPGLPAWGLLPLLFFGFFPASDLALGWVDRFVTRMVPPRRLCRLEFPEGLPREFRTFVVVPTLLEKESHIPGQVERLEVHYLSNPGGDVRFALLTDWPDAGRETDPQDARTLAPAVQGIDALNAKYGPAPGGGPRFFLFHRKRLWNASEGKWMGWERKRGKLHEFNRLLRGATDTSYQGPDGRPACAPPGVRYVVTLDADTRLPPGVVQQLAGILAHPLNRAHLDPRLGRVVEGYGILQPRVTAFWPGEDKKSIFQRLFSGEGGIDPYASAVSDVYQDLFGEGSFTGKGILDVDAYESALAGRIPDNSLLSHDLFEGSFARCGYAGDLEFFEEFPSHVGTSGSRNHRWIRGDWQLLLWIFGREGAALSALARWKMIDNLRRSLSALGTVGLLFTAFGLPAAQPWVWAGLVLLGLGVPTLPPFLEDLAFGKWPPRRADPPSDLLRGLKLGSARLLVNLALTANRAWMHLDAIIRTLWRLFISRRDLLEWKTMAQSESGSSLSVRSFFRRMRGSLSIGLAMAASTTWLDPKALPFAVPLSALWLAAPWLARWISLPGSRDPIAPLTPGETLEFRLAGRRIWGFFTRFAGPEDHFLPPDNFQEDPEPVLAHRGSPTNFGLYLLSIVTARDFGWCGWDEMMERLGSALASLGGIPRFRGHYYNWTDTRTLQPLEPRYVSSVDSGNLAGHLLALSQSCRDLARQPPFTPAMLSGIGDAVALLKLALRGSSPKGRKAAASLSRLEKEIGLLEGHLGALPRHAADWNRLELQAGAMQDAAQAFVSGRPDGEGDGIRFWAGEAFSGVKSHAADFHRLFPWAAALGGFGRSPQARDLQALLDELLAGSRPWPRIPRLCETALEALETLRRSIPPGAMGPSLRFAAQGLALSAERARETLARLAEADRRSRELFDAMDFRFLLDPAKELFSIGYRVADGQLDGSCYDLLASESRLASYVAILKGDAPFSHWFRLGRGLAAAEGGRALLASWSGSMFEYLMPALVMESPAGSLLDQTCRRAVQSQVHYGDLRRVPWGISEAGYNARDLQLTYQYSSFGVPGLGLKRGLGKDLVVAPYATALAALVDPRAALLNLRRLEKLGARGLFGFYEALDYTPSRLPEGEPFALIRSYMAHHQAMSLLAFSNVVHGSLLRRRFHADPLVQAGELLLQEKPPRHPGAALGQARETGILGTAGTAPALSRKVRSPHHPIPSSHLLSNGRYAVMLTAAGSGYSLRKDLAVTRWRADATRDHYGTYFFLRDAQKGSVWSATFQPTLVHSPQYQAVFSEERVKFSRLDDAIAADLEVIVSAEDDAELRRITLTNQGDGPREIEMTSYCEVALAPPAADLAHRAFSNLFIRTEFLPELSALTAGRRPRSPSEGPAYMAQVVSHEGPVLGDIEYETDRAQFIGRGGSLARPRAVQGGRPLANRVGDVLDPILSLRVRVRLAPGASAKVCFTTLASDSRMEMLALAEKYHNASAFERASGLVWTQAAAALYHLGIDPEEAQLFQRLANRILFSDPLLRPTGEILRKNRLDRTGLWSRGISGDLPILLVRIDDLEDPTLIRQLLRAHDYWRLKRLAVDIVIVNEKAASYTQELQTALEGMVRGSSDPARGGPDPSPGKFFVLRGDLLDPREKELLAAVARAILSNRSGTLAEQVLRVRRSGGFAPTQGRKLAEMEAARLRDRTEPPLAVPPLEFFNGVGGFADGGREYAVVLGKGRRTPAPWINVVANPGFGFQVSESGAGYTWAVNSRENQITPWSNDPVLDPPGEAFFLGDLDTGALWSPTASPIRLEGASYLARHGAGYSVFENGSNGIHSTLTQFVDPEAPVKISRLVLENTSGRARRLSVTGYVEWVLGFSRDKNSPFIRTWLDPETGAVFAANPLDPEFGTRVSYVDLNGAQTAWTCDRTEFLGRNGSLEAPAALCRREKLSGFTGAGADPCGALQALFEIAPGGKKELAFFLGQAENPEKARAQVKRTRRADLGSRLQAVVQNWDRLLDKIQVRTPDRSLDLMLNRWLLYQTIACRFWARAGFYQAGGAFGFRDQLQDGMAVAMTDPGLAREHLLRAASRQFAEGDAQHWWHPPRGRGVRTRISDDRLWLPYAALHYLRMTEDPGLLEEQVPFLEGPPLAPLQEDSYFEPALSPGPPRSLYEHCARALDISLKTGVHGLPLMGAGDWNDGMNRVGREGKGESVWLAWFLLEILAGMAPLAADRGETGRHAAWTKKAGELRAALEGPGWDGAWYKRAFFDDGSPLGSSANAECKIDSIPQTWSVLSGAGDPARARRAMQAVDQMLVRDREKLVLLFTPPLDHTPKDPGYIKGYLPGIRENGGQYTHAAVWCVCAAARLGLGGRAGELFAMLNPIHHALTPAQVEVYKVEPYVLAADVYGKAPHVGRGGWTWYTGSAGWMYRAGVEFILGIHLRGDRLHFDPCVPKPWPGFGAHYRHGTASYAVEFENPDHVSSGVLWIELDGERIEPAGMGLELRDDGKTHQVKVRMGPAGPGGGGRSKG